MCRGLGLPLPWGAFFRPLWRFPCEWILRNTEETRVWEYLLVLPWLLWLPEGAYLPSLLLEKVAQSMSTQPGVGVYQHTPRLPTPLGGDSKYYNSLTEKPASLTFIRRLQPYL